MAAYDNPPRYYKSGEYVLLEKDRDGKAAPLSDTSKPCSFVLLGTILGSDNVVWCGPDDEWKSQDEGGPEQGPGVRLPANAADAQGPLRIDVDDVANIYVIREALTAAQVIELEEQEATEETEAEEAEKKYIPPQTRIPYVYAASE